MTEKDDGACSAMFMRLVVFFPCKRCNCVTNKPVFPFSTALQTGLQEGLRIFLILKFRPILLLILHWEQIFY